jgi:hypothetical protein
MKGLVLAILSAWASAHATLTLPSPTISLAWDPSPAANIAGYRLYQGGASQTYTNVTDLGNVCSAPIWALAPGATYYFAVTVYNETGLESQFSAEVSYTVPVPGPVQPPLNLFLLGNQITLVGSVTPSQTYFLQASEDLVTWSWISTVTADKNGYFQFVDKQPATLPQHFYRLQKIPTK